MAGRPKLPEDKKKVQVCIVLGPKEIAKLDSLAFELGVNRSQAAAFAINNLPHDVTLEAASAQFKDKTDEQKAEVHKQRARVQQAANKRAEGIGKVRFQRSAPKRAIVGLLEQGKKEEVIEKYAHLRTLQELDPFEGSREQAIKDLGSLITAISSENGFDTQQSSGLVDLCEQNFLQHRERYLTLMRKQLSATG